MHTRRSPPRGDIQAKRRVEPNTPMLQLCIANALPALAMATIYLPYHRPVRYDSNRRDRLAATGALFRRPIKEDQYHYQCGSRKIDPKAVEIRGRRRLSPNGP